MSVRRMTMTTPWLGAACMALLLGGCGSLLTTNDLQSRQADAEIEMAKRRLASERAEIDNPAMYRALIEKMQTEGLYFASLAHIDAYEQRFGTTDELALRRADAQRATGQDALADAGYRKLLASPVAAQAWHGLGLLAGGNGRFPEAITALREAAQRDPTNALMSSDLGYALMRSGAVEAARVPVLRAGELAPQNRNVLSNIALYLLASGDAPRAEAMMQQLAFPETTQQAVRRDALAIRLAGQRAPAASAVPDGGGKAPAVSGPGVAGKQQGRVLERFAAGMPHAQPQ